jgi:hypothetical protein
MVLHGYIVEVIGPKNAHKALREIDGHYAGHLTDGRHIARAAKKHQAARNV